MFKRWIPERDTGPSVSAPQPKPRQDLKTREISSKLLGTGDSSVSSSVESGLDNQAYVNDETDEPHQHYLASNRSSSSESDSSHINRETKAKSQFSKPDTSETDAPRPKPRRRTEKAIESGSETYTCTTDSSVAQSPIRYSKAQDHVIVSIPEKPSDAEIKEPRLPMKRRDRRHSPDSDVESGNQEEIELQSLNLPVRDRPHGRTADTELVSYVSEVNRAGTTKSLLENENMEGIQRLQTMLSPGRTSENQPSTSAAGIASPSKRERRRIESGNTGDRKFGVYIHYCDLLPVDPNVVHPVVKVSILNEDGTCVARSIRKTSLDNGHKVSSPDLLSSKEKRSKKRRTRNGRSRSGKEGGDSPPATTSKPEKSATKLPCKLTNKAVLPIMTQPCKLSYYLPTFAPFWNELLLFDEPFSNIVQPDSKAMLFFEIMDFLPLAGPHKNSRTWNGYHGNEQGWYKVAWGFLKLIGANGSRNVNRKLKLQLFRPETIPSKQRIPDMAEVYQWWKLGKRNKFDSSLCITVRAVLTPKEHIQNLDKMLNLDENQLSQALLDSQVDTNSFKNGKRTDKRKSTEVAVPQWTRLEGQTCKIPNKLIKNLPESQMESFNIGIAGDVYCVKFSPCGLKLAAGLHGDDYHSILIFEIPSGKLISNIKSHYGLVYDIDWRALNPKSAMMPNLYYLATASADSVSCVWDLRSPQNTVKLVKKLLHPSFVYCVRFHPTKPNLVFTGCFDCAIRIWDIGRSSPDKASMHESNTETVPIALLNEHKSYVNTMVFGQMGNSLYSGDGTGTVIEWTTQSSGRKKSWTKERELSFSEAGKSPVNSLDIHPNGNKLLVHIRNSLLKLVDISTFLVLQSYNGLVNDKLQIRSCFSPCGNLVLSGSEDGMICFWDADTGSILQFLVSENHKNATVTSVHYHPHDHYVTVGFASSFNEPCPIALYAYKALRSAKLRFQTLTKLATWTSTSSEQALPELNEDSGNVGESGATSDKFMMIIKKLDSALKLTSKSNPTTAIGGNANRRRSLEALTNEIPSTSGVFPSAVQPSKANTGEPVLTSERTAGSLVTRKMKSASVVRTSTHDVGGTADAQQVSNVAHDEVSLLEQNSQKRESTAPNTKQRQKRRDKMRLARNFDNFMV